ncbi:glycogen debranching enzyme N-terminal domain-containing protein [Ktedonobacteria bacterium brp13]|nr:glycogen debranching enzyme N-terminal domain-containing protein [Ktedonobacteria bacterium brp13]
MTISFDRNLCCDRNETISREWLVTNGLGGYAAGTVAGVLTRIQHGLLVATPPNAVTPQLLLAKIDEEVTFDQRTYYLGTNEYRDGTISPSGFVHLETFRLEAGFPIFTYHLGGIDGIVLEKRIWMVNGYNTTYIQYRVLPQQAPDKPIYKRDAGASITTSHSHGLLKPTTTDDTRSTVELTLLPLTAYRPANVAQHGSNDYHFHIHVHDTEMRNGAEEKSWTTHLPAGVAGCTIQAHTHAHPYHMLAVGVPRSQAIFIPTGVWYWNFLRRCDARSNQERQQATDDLYLPGVIRATLWPDENVALTIVVSTEELDSRLYHREQIALLYRESQHDKEALIAQTLLPEWGTASSEDEQEIRDEESEAGDEGEDDEDDEEDQEQAIEANELSSTIGTETDTQYKEYLRYLLYAREHFLVQMKAPETNKAVRRGAHNTHMSAGLPGIARRARVNTGSLFSNLEPELLIRAEYFSLENRTRDTLIALPGLLLGSERYAEARHYLSRLAEYIIDGLLPERMPTPEHALTDADYRSVDIPLWYCHALDQYINVTQDYYLLEEVFPALKEWIRCYIQGMRKGIYVDSYDGLLYAEKDGQACTWMNAYKHGVPITPRAGKPVEVNALWYQALQLMAEWSEMLATMGHAERESHSYRELAETCQQHFQRRFWNEERGYLYDVIDGPRGDDPTLRVNQIFTLTLRHSVLAAEYRQRILDVITQHLVTPYGLRTLAPEEPGYHGYLLAPQQGQQVQEEIELEALHQGAVWTWLLGPYMDAIIAQELDTHEHKDSKLSQEYLWRKGMQLLEPLKERFHVTLLGMCEGIFPGDVSEQGATKYQPGQQLASLTTTAELLRLYTRLTNIYTEQPAGALSY